MEAARSAAETGRGGAVWGPGGEGVRALWRDGRRPRARAVSFTARGERRAEFGEPGLGLLAGSGGRGWCGGRRRGIAARRCRRSSGEAGPKAAGPIFEWAEWRRIETATGAALRIRTARAARRVQRTPLVVGRAAGMGRARGAHRDGGRRASRRRRALLASGAIAQLSQLREARWARLLLCAPACSPGRPRSARASSSPMDEALPARATGRTRATRPRCSASSPARNSPTAAAR